MNASLRNGANKTFLTGLAALALLMGISAASVALAQNGSQSALEAEGSPSSDLPLMWNGNACAPDAARVCLGVEGISRADWVRCLRAHYDQLTPDCKEIMAPSNFKTPLEPEALPNAKAAPTMFNQ